MVQRTTIALSDDTHKYLTGVAHERSMSGTRRVSLNTVIAEICDIAVDEMRKTDARRTARRRAAAASEAVDGD